MKTNLTIDQIAELLGKKVWNGKRIYMNNVGYNTKKMKTAAYYYINCNEILASVYVDCDSQPQEWCSSQADQFKAGMMEDIKELLLPKKFFIEADTNVYVNAEGKKVSEKYLFDTEEEADAVKGTNYGWNVEKKFIYPVEEPIIENEPSDTIVTTEGEVVDLSETVKGFYGEWREVRISINRFGKLATRNKQFLIVTEIAKKNAPSKFIIMNDADFEAVKNYMKGEMMLEAYVEPAVKVNEILRRIASVAD